MDIKEAIKQFGFDPTSIGMRHRGWWIVDTVDSDEDILGIKKGYLCIEARDGASNEIDPDAFKQPNYVTSMEDWGDCTFRYYYYKPIAEGE